MSEFWSGAEEVATAILGMFEKTFQDQQILAKISGLNVLMAYVYNDPDVTIWFKSREGEIAYGSGEPPEKPDVKFTLCADDAHRVWSNKLNVMVSIAKKKIKLEGNATRILKLTPLLRTFAANYNEKLREMGKESIILT